MASATLPDRRPAEEAGALRGVDPARRAVVAAWRRLGLMASGAVTAAQIARMASTLNELSDAELARIGIARHEIYSHAEKLVLTGGTASAPDAAAARRDAPKA